MSGRKGIKDIAMLAGVSIGTVDRVIHKRGRVSAETRNKIEEIIRQIDYKPNLHARRLVKNKKITVTLLMPNPIEDEYWKQAWEGIECSLLKFEHQGIYLEPYFYSLYDKVTFETAAIEIIKVTPSGLIMAPNFLEEGRHLYDKCNEASIPVIMFDTIIPKSSPLTFIGTDSFQSGKVAAELLHLTSAQIGKFAILHFDEELINSPHMQEKEQGFLSYISDECPERECIVEVLNNEKHFYQSQLIELLANNDIVGIYVSTSKIYRVGQFLENQNIKDVRLVGYDLVSKNIDLMRQGYIDFIINQNPRRQAELSISNLCNYLIYNQDINSKYLFPIEIITKMNLESYFKDVLD
jgi:LacI family transcriptional regulator